MDFRGAEIQAREAEDRLAEQRGLVRDLTAVLEKRNAKIAQQREALEDARQALNLALLANDFGGDIKGRLRTAWLKVGDALTLKD